MTFLIISHVPHIFQNQQYLGYGPYIREMNIWLKHVNKVIIVAPLENNTVSLIHLAYDHPNIEFIAIKSFNFINFFSAITTIFKLPKIIYQIFKASQKADHIHVRCPGNVGLLGCIVQMFFPSYPKTAKYAGNWDLKSKQPLTYKLQQYILNNAFLTRNMQVLVYGEWKGTSKNIKSFFTASYAENDKIEVKPRSLEKKIKFVFVGTLVKGKNPLYVIQIVQKLIKHAVNATLDLYGEGNQKEVLQNYIVKNNLQKFVTLHGNQNQEVVKKAYQESHFVLLPSDSEGWPKAIAEGMFWGCIPVATSVSCVPYMLDFGKRGLLLNLNLDEDYKKIMDLVANSDDFNKMSNNAIDWSQKYTLDYFEQEIKLLLKS